ncbi:DUF3606 domain-containing protein [Aureimonas sp. AU12]|uniref:DUF3606 domain-containing protein n=1 Tax=Aureimonas sp. AU12 TaxID=1638161 RepID=UPI000782BC67|nr:DUF3606 domain-containing protein [Aureimonas sp. AU12]
MTETSKTKPDLKRGAAAEVPYDADSFAKKFGIPPSEAKTIIKRYGPSRKKLDSHMAARQA